MNRAAQHPVLKAKAYKSDIKPIWCPGCGHYGVLSALTKALAHLEIVPERLALVSGIGCSSRIPAYLATYGFHGLHGRALPLAAGLKAARPDLTVIVASGDGDAFSIGGNHFLHACRRNQELTCIVMDNQVYGMTKGQASPTTPPDWTHAKLTPHGTGIPSFRPAAIALAAGAGFIARGFAGEPNHLAQLLVEAITYRGFAFVHVLSPCVTFRPDEQAWKQAVREWAGPPTDDPVAAAARLHGDDGLNIGIIYRTQLPVWQPRAAPVPGAADPSEGFLL